MPTPNLSADIAPYDNTVHRQAVIDLWRRVFRYDTPHNSPALAIDKKLEMDDGLFLVALFENEVIGTVMAGYDGHRGWIYSLAVQLEKRRQGIGTRLMACIEEKLKERGCLKVNLQIVAGNETVQDFYSSHGYRVEPRISMGKLLE